MVKIPVGTILSVMVRYIFYSIFHVRFHGWSIIILKPYLFSFNLHLYQCANLDLNFNDKRYCFFFQGLDFADSESTGTSFGPLALGSSGDEDGDDEEIVLDPYDEEYKPYKPSPGIQYIYC